MSSDLQIFEKINDYIVNEESFAFALVIDTWKSAPKPVGSILLISSEDEIFGSVSGGCVESAVIVEAKNSLNTKKTIIENKKRPPEIRHICLSPAEGSIPKITRCFFGSKPME